MKQQIARLIRRFLPISLVYTAEEVYRRSRVWLVSARYGWPARSLRIIAVTGTNGKTTTVNYLNAILKQAGYRTAMFSTALIEVDGRQSANELNMTVASTAEMQRFFRDAKIAHAEFVVLEITSHSLHQHKLDGVPIEVAVMTNLTQDHLDYHKTMQNYAAAKGLLFARRPRYIVLNRDDDWYEFYHKYKATERSISYGQTVDADLRYTVAAVKQASMIDITLDHTKKFIVQTALPGEYNAANLAAATASAFLLGVTPSDITAGAATLKGIPGRFEHIVTNQPYDVVVDYAHTPDALKQLLQTTRAMTSGKVILVFGACGDRDKTKRPLMGEIAAQLADTIYLTDEESYSENPDSIRAMIYDGIKKAGAETKTTEIADRRAAIEAALAHAQPTDRILITGMGHEKYRIINGKRLPWNDGDITRELLNV